MNKEQVQNLCGQASLTIVEAMQKIDENEKGILFITTEDERLIGAVTDGDIRRWLIKTADLSSKVEKLMNKNPQFLYVGDRKNAYDFMKKKMIHALPILDSEARVVDIALADEKDFASINSRALENVPVIIMAGGKGTRLYPYTKILPKPLIPIGDIPILERIINRFYEYGVSQYYMTVNYKKGMIKSYFAELNPRYSIEYVEEDKPLGTAGSIQLIGKEFETPVIVMNCDTLIEADYEDIYEYHKKSGNAMTIVSALKNLEVPYGVLKTGENGVITAFEEKPKLSYLVNTGMYVVDGAMLNKIPKDKFFHMTHLAEKLMREGLQVGMYPISEESFLDMGEFEEMRRMEDKLNIK
ncbi:MAG: nucleotidyltransferase family protein [Tyzzerella sp.]|nr:nucleotidyltransferase family protein [Tyzzerella sp.]